jgi:hypothetical protein
MSPKVSLLWRLVIGTFERLFDMLRGMRILRSTLVVSLVSAPLVVACGEDEAVPAVSPEVACDEAASALCDKFQECAPFLTSSLFVDSASCAARFKINCASSFSATGTSATPERTQQCARDARAATCEDLLGRNSPESCRTVAGTLEDGAVCGHDAQCKNKLCRVAKDSTCGACSSLGAAGAACERAEDCDNGLTCVDSKCIAYGKTGHACSATQPCLPTLACNNGVCAAPLAAGGACTFKLGENPCDAAKGLYCHPKSNVCAAIETAAAGGTCELSLEKITACTAGSQCKIAKGSTTGPCVAPAADGASCNDENGPKCIAPARCTGGVCTIADPAKCK